MSAILVLACKRCDAPIDPGARTHLRGRVLLDLACDACGRRALYEVPWVDAAGN